MWAKIRPSRRKESPRTSGGVHRPMGTATVLLTAPSGRRARTGTKQPSGVPAGGSNSISSMPGSPGRGAARAGEAGEEAAFGRAGGRFEFDFVDAGLAGTRGGADETGATAGDEDFGMAFGAESGAGEDEGALHARGSPAFAVGAVETQAGGGDAHGEGTRYAIAIGDGDGRGAERELGGEEDVEASTGGGEDLERPAAETDFGVLLETQAFDGDAGSGSERAIGEGGRSATGGAEDAFLVDRGRLGGKRGGEQ